MFRLFFLLLLTTSVSLSAQEKIEVYATSMESQDEIIKAHGDVTVVYKEYFLTAKEAVYDRQNGKLELFGNVRANRDNQYKVLGEYARLNIINKERAFKPFYMLEKRSQVWISSEDASAKECNIKISKGTMSGCNPNDPIWTLDFSSSDYNTETKWLDIYNTRLYIYDIPVFYTPYFGYSLDTTRKTGLLLPTLGYSQDEGFYYEQPIYIAEQNWWDLELKPQIRTNRGSGLYSKFRFVDSALSRGELNLGYFQEKSDYFKANKLANDAHYGFDFFYENSDFINQWLDVELKGQSGIFVDIANMNDVDYINLSENNSIENVTSSQILSRINMFYNGEENYYGAYFKHYKDLTLSSNKNTLQQLPMFHYHSYMDTFFKNHLFFNVDLKSTNMHRDVNKKAIQTDVNIPITVQTTLFDEYLNFSYTSNLYAQHTDFSGSELTVSGLNYDDGLFLRQYNTFTLSTQLTKAFKEFVHVVGLSIDYTFDGAKREGGFYEYRENNNEFYNIKEIDELTRFNFTQYLYDDSGNQILYHRLSQNMYNQKEGDEKYGELDNEIEYYFNESFSVYNNLLYNYEHDKLSKIQSSLILDSDMVDFKLSHLYRDHFDGTNDNYLSASVEYRYDNHYSYTARYDYDLELNLRKSAEIGFLYKKRCWEFGLEYVENNRPILENINSSSVQDRYIYVTIILKPFVESGSRPLFMHQLPQND